MAPSLARPDVGVDQHRNRFEPGDDDALRGRNQDAVVIVLVPVRLVLTNGRRTGFVAATRRTTASAASGASRFLVVVERRDIVGDHEIVIEVGFVQMVSMARTARTTGSATAPSFAPSFVSSRTRFASRSILARRTVITSRPLLAGRSVLTGRSVFTRRTIFPCSSLVTARTSLSLAAPSGGAARVASGTRLSLTSFRSRFPIATSGAFAARCSIRATGSRRGRRSLAIAATAIREIVQIVFGRVDQRQIVFREVVAR